jgi:hypothetical protein
MTEISDPPTEAPQTTRNDSTVKPKRKSDVHPDPRIIIGFASGTGGVAIGMHEISVKSVTVGLAVSAICTGLYLAWLHGRDRYMRWVIARHTYRPTAGRLPRQSPSDQQPRWPA